VSHDTISRDVANATKEEKTGIENQEVTDDDVANATPDEKTPVVESGDDVKI